MILEYFSQGKATAAGNMALDLMLLEDYPRKNNLRLRHYEWTENCFTFGYSQKYHWIEGQCPVGAELARRPTGGGLVDHRNDWTFAFVLPAAHPMHHAPAIDVYRLVHQAIADALCTRGRAATLQPEEDEEEPTAMPGMPKKVRGLCFAGAEPCDVIDPTSRIKIAGAAMKRNKHGVLLQGSIDKLVAGESVDWARFEQDFTQELCKAFHATLERAATPPSYQQELETNTTNKLAADSWLKRR